VIVIRETQGWWKVRDPQGDEVWVRQGQLANEHTVIARVDGAILKRAHAKAAELATFQAGAVMSFKGCADGWCRVEAQGREGYVIDRLVWGAEELPAS
jgi:SH3-like domain-containing protein